METVRVFAGNYPGQAEVEPGAVAALTVCDKRVQHYEIVLNVEGI